MGEILLLVRLALFGVFALAAIGKLMDPEGSEKAVKGFGVPDSLAKPVGVGLPIFELVLAFLFLFVSTSWFAAIAAVLLISVFIGGMIYQIAQGKAPDCHCFGQIHSEPVGKSSLLRNAGFAILALFLAIQGRANQGASLADDNSGMTIVLILVLAVLAVGVFYLKRIFDQQGELIRRIDLLELISKDGQTVERVEAVPPTEGLAIGSPFPEFQLKGLDGTAATKSDIFGAKPAIVFFVSPDCSPCKALYPEIKEWQKELGEKLDFVFVSSGDLKANRDKYGDTDGIRVIVEEKRELAESVKAQWTPSALFVNADGRIGSYVSTGDSAIRLLIDDLRERELGVDFVFVVNSVGASQALKIGQSVPDFSLQGADGETVTKDAIAGRNTLAVFWSMTCPHCVNMKEAIVELEKTQNGAGPNFIFFSDGNPAENRELGFESPVVQDARYTISKELGMSGTPSAVLIDDKGRIASGTATGEQKIWALLGKKPDVLG
jgi:thiol-disulfide isomerase/thioredoxin